MSKLGKNKNWTLEEKEIAIKLLDRKATDKEFWDAIGRGRNAAYCHIYYHNNGRARLKDKPIRPRKKGRTLVEKKDTSGKIHWDWEYVCHRPTEQMLADAERRNLAPRSITAYVCGDPPPGYSALDKMKG